ncbi:hypothetical protein CEXT_608051 [Caerostris extrusa]|uniref:Uncharacterized protein n=1 Tax=Caerostris extrusa TaxID=172846 RepID=A0AAV4W6F8_CAEEX|nr:hypothetical protein CEXT_608051 [Caerostris extrusa]
MEHNLNLCDLNNRILQRYFSRGLKLFAAPFPPLKINSNSENFQTSFRRNPPTNSNVVSEIFIPPILLKTPIIGKNKSISQTDRPRSKYQCHELLPEYAVSDHCTAVGKNEN